MRSSWILAVLLSACAGEARSTGGVDLQVLVRTDLAVGLEFAWVEISLPERGLTSRVPAVLGSYLDAREVAFLVDLPPTRHRHLKVSLLDRHGAEVVSRPMVFAHERRMAVVARLSRTCREHDCPEACHGGRCVDPGCLDGSEVDCEPTDPTTPTPEPGCRSATDCPALDGCARAVCDEGVCWAEADDSRCAADRVCSPDLGCVPRPEPDLDAGVDAGIAELDAEVIDVGESDPTDGEASIDADASVGDAGETSDASPSDASAEPTDDGTVDAGAVDAPSDPSRDPPPDGPA
jgi:hypothetical protein